MSFSLEGISFNFFVSFIFDWALIFRNKTNFFQWPHFEPLQLQNGGSVTQTNYIFWILSA